MGITVLPRRKNFGEEFAEKFGAGLEKGISSGQEFAQKVAADQAKQEAKINALMSYYGATDKGEASAENGTGQIQPKEIEPEGYRPGEATLFPEEARERREREKMKRQEETVRETTGEKRVEKIQDKIESLESSELRFNRLNKLLSPELDTKFPPPILAALFSKEGEINGTMLSQLSPEAQETIKLLADEIQGAKDTFGSRVTNFDLVRYLKRLPSLINTPDGRRKILQDLRIMNKLNLMQNQGVLDIIEREGGTRKISVSKAKEMWKKENKGKLTNLKKMFIDPENPEITELDDFTASLFPGIEIEDEETGQKFRSTGNDWEML